MSTIFEVDLDAITTFGFGQTKTTVESRLAGSTSKFPNFNDEDSNWANIKLDAGGGDPYIELKSTIANHSKIQWRSSFTKVDECYARYSIYFSSEGGSGHPADGGYDFGDGDGTPVTNVTGGKMPGLCGGALADNTGGVLANGAWSGRLMWRGNRKSDGIGSSNREGHNLELYYYGNDEGTQKRYNFCNSDDPADAVVFTSNGTTAGTYGDPRTTNIPIDTWIHIMVGHYVPDSTAGWAKAWTWIEGTDTSWQPQLYKTGMRPRTSGNSGIDGFVFQQYWGGNTADWQPDRVAHTRFKDIGVYTTQAEAEEAFGLTASTTEFEITSPAADATQLDSPISVSGTAADDGATDYQLYAYNETQASSISDYEVDATFTSGTEIFVGDSTLDIGKAGDEITLRARRLT